MPTRPASTLDGWRPRLGQLVWETIYAPHTPGWDSAIHDRIEHGDVYRGPILMRVHSILDDHPSAGVQTWLLRHPGAKLGSSIDGNEGWFPSKVEGPSIVDSSWAVLVDASDQDAQEALF